MKNEREQNMGSPMIHLIRQSVDRLQAEITSLQKLLDEALRPERKMQPLNVNWSENRHGGPYKTIALPHGTQARMPCYGKWHDGVVSDGGLVVGGRRFKSLSATASVVANGTSRNGRRDWQFMLPGTARWQSVMEIVGGQPN
jgi:hypothetical protein